MTKRMWLFGMNAPSKLYDWGLQALHNGTDDDGLPRSACHFAPQTVINEMTTLGFEVDLIYTAVECPVCNRQTVLVSAVEHSIHDCVVS